MSRSTRTTSSRGGALLERPDPPRPDDAATAYARDVVAGVVLACRWFRLACARHLRDLEDGHERGLRWDPHEVEDIRLFFLGLRHSKGEWAGRPIVLEPWQLFTLGCIFGWKRADQTRRFRRVYIEIPRKSGKSTLAAGVGLRLAFFDEEAGAECYSAATKRDQAKIVWGEARRMVLRSRLRERIVTLAANLHEIDTASKFEPLGADADSLDGLNIHGAIVDELHAHKTRAMWDVLDTATGARRQPLIFAITTAGLDRKSVCREQHDHTVRVLTGRRDDDAFFGLIATLDVCDACFAKGKTTPTDSCRDCDQWTDERVWGKANPMHGVSVKPDELREQCARARAMPSAQTAFKRLRLNLWTTDAERAIPADQWARGNARVDPAALIGRRCVLGLDLATTKDLAAAVLVFPDADFFVETPPESAPADAVELVVKGGVDVLPFFWCPEDGIRERSQRDRVEYERWAREKFLEPTPGNAIDYRRIRRRINELRDAGYDIAEVCYDPAFAMQLALQLQDEDGFTVVPVAQGFNVLNEPAVLFETLLLRGTLRHGGHPVLAWNAENLVYDVDSGGRKRPSKRKSTERIDGVTALITGLKRVGALGQAGGWRPV